MQDFHLVALVLLFDSRFYAVKTIIEQGKMPYYPGRPVL